MKKTDKTAKGYNEKNPVQTQGSITPDKNDEKLSFPGDATPNEKLSIPERRLRKNKKRVD